MSDRLAHFDDWANTCDADIATAGGFPFAGYERALAHVVDLADPRPGDRVLDLGIGVGHLAARFEELRCVVTGVDFSPAMLGQAARRVPSATLHKMDLLGDGAPLVGQRFATVASGYVLHQFDDVTKLTILERVLNGHLLDDGQLIIADIAFETRTDAGHVAARSTGGTTQSTTGLWTRQRIRSKLRVYGCRSRRCRSALV